MHSQITHKMVMRPRTEIGLGFVITLEGRARR